MKFRVAPLLIILLLPLLVGFSKKPKYTITLHAQGEETDMNKAIFPIMIEGKQMIFKIVPEVSQQNIVAFHPFDSPTSGKGVALQLDSRGRDSLYIASRTRQGEILLAMVNGQPADYVVIDQVIENGMITIWRGVPETVIAEMGKKITRIKPGAAPTMSASTDMLPTTKKEKRTFWRMSKKKDKEEEKHGKPVEKEIPRLDAPGAPMTNAIPDEGAAPSPSSPPAAAPPPPRGPVSEPTLPRP